MAPRRRPALLLLVLACAVRLSAALYSPGGAVFTDVTDANYRKALKGLTLLELYAPWCGHCKALAPEWEKLASAMKALGGLTVAAADCDANKQVAAAYGVKGFPTIVAVLDGKLVDTYTGERTAAAIGKWGLSTANKQLAAKLGGGGGGSSSSGAGGKAGGGAAAEPGGGKAVLKLTASNFDAKVTNSDAPLLVEFYAPWCGHCKQLAPNWAKAAEELAPRGMQLGAVDCTANEELCGRFDVKGYPHILVFGRDKGKPKVYDGPRTASEIVSFGLKLLETDGAPPEVAQLLSGEQYGAACTATGRQACVLAFLPHIQDTSAAARKRSLEALSASAGSFASRPWGWAWLEAGAQPELETALGVSQFPSVVMVNAKKAVASRMKAALSGPNLKEFLNHLPSAEPVSLPSVDGLAATAPWDGQDAPPPQLEEEIPLDEL